NIGGPGINQIESLDRSKFGLVEVASTQWHDLVFINLSGDAPPFAEFISPLAERWAPYWGSEGPSLLRLGESYSRIELELSANWKLAVENYLEAYHLPTVHPALNKVSPLADHEIYLAEDFAGQLSHCYTLGAGADGRLPVFPAWPKDAYQEAQYPALFPNTLLGLQADHLFVMVVIPLAYNRTLEETRLYCVGDQALSPRFAQLRKAQHTFWREVFAEDIDVVTGLQAGRASSGFDGGVLTPVMDSATAAFHRWVGERLGFR
ncbi:MAG: aromatic ring-hydroxylating dioxygenase subunit alpha, partial [Acidiferrobacteraceae bacterium]|nr:aromatic ring-hydroxylating dioxygenase subunit alpha [Acidiferrobacteraceae bacterium]MBT3972719.1 aromatic ring-hydroxylating dioxygenase subunit alpha [Acidiferrobacteraceae bacterium]MBT4403563.1 aromatic ring-hydroxylating dioxygenase subunit alpha [Acidiferrobacteraceae bacterium]MBT5344623.1 aromatic ring-hydroxylating dioxygenase subunit alpha [Acidiferrobacteraceae bacterium]MBT5621976.1 aromatic ring-hydroxylating dioxygenase subunit alpha [Acidiferrobacteraceae bacterium]